MDIDGTLLLEMMQNKEAMVNELLAGIDEMDQIYAGTQSVISSIEAGSEANARKQLKNNMAAMMKVTKRVKQLLLVNLVVVSSDDFTSMVAKMGMRVGGKDPRTFLKAMFDQKMKGKI